MINYFISKIIVVGLAIIDVVEKTTTIKAVISMKEKNKVTN